MSHRQRAVGLAAALIAALVAALLLLGGDDDAARAAEAPGAAPAPATGAASAAGAATMAIEVERGPSLDLSAEKIERVLEDYKRDAIYPHWSRPLEPGDAYKLRWNQAITSDLDMDDRPGHETLYRFDADRAHVGFGEAYTSWIEVWQKGDRTRRVPITIHAASVHAVTGAAQGKVLDLAYRDDGQGGDEVAGDRIYTNRFVPSDHEELRAAQMVHVQANVEAEGGATRVMTRDFTYTPRPTVEIERVTDAIVGGHLAVTLHLEVFEPGTYTIEANCFAADGETPIAYVREFFQLGAGAQTATLRFFGKIFHDQGIDGPYVIRDVRGFLRFFDSDELNLWFMYGRDHVTARYLRSQLDPAEWDDEEKRERIKGYEQLLDEARRGGR